MRVGYALPLLGLVVLGVGAKVIQTGMPARTLPTGSLISPEGGQTNVGSFPCNLAMSPDGKFLLVTDSGFREYLSVLDGNSGKLLAQGKYGNTDVNGMVSGPQTPGVPSALYYGLALQQMPDGTQLAAISHGAFDQISIARLGADGLLTNQKILRLPYIPNPLHLQRHVAGLAWSKDGSRLYVVANQSHIFNNFTGTISVFDVKSGAVLGSAQVGSFPLSVVVLPSGGVSVTNEGGREITLLDANLKNPSQLVTGQQPTYETINHAGSKLYVSNSDSDTVSEVDLRTLKVAKTILLRPNELHGYPGTTPLGSALSPDDKTLYVAMADLNAVAVVDTGSGTIKGYAPVGWYPTSVALSADGSSLFVANAKGVQSQNPNGKDVNGLGRYDENILEGTVSKIDLGQLATNLPNLTQVVAANNHLSQVASITFHNPGIQHVFYVIKENRTYDQILGDMPKGNGDSTLTVFGQNNTPNQHALAARFGLYDNFYTCAEVSADGWHWSVSGLANEYVQRNTPYSYSRRGRNIESDGMVNQSPVDLLGIRDVSEAPGGYVWDSVLQKGLSVRDYGMFVSYGEPVKGPDGNPIEVDNMPTRKNLVPLTCTDFREFDLSFPDSDAQTQLGLPRAPKELATYGTHNDTSRMDTWLREFKQYVAQNNLPSLNLLRLMRDHMAGGTVGLSAPQAMVADNDYAVGQLVDAVSHSPYWKSSVILVVEDDSQNGFDHVDCHRSPMLVISPFTTPGKVDSSFYNTDSVLATIERIFNSSFGNQYLATARPFDVFVDSSPNSAPYSAILPDKAIVGMVNGKQAYRAKDSERMISLYREDSCADFELNEIIWHTIKGRSAPLPKTPGVIWTATPGTAKPGDDDD